MSNVMPTHLLPLTGIRKYTTMETLGERIRRLREDRGLTQQRLADLADLAQSAIARIEAGNREPLITSIQRIARALGVSVNDIVVDTLPNDPEPEDKEPQLHV